MKIRTNDEAIRLQNQALWYAWGRIDGDPALQADGFGTEHGQQFGELYRELADDYASERRSFRPSVLDAFRVFVEVKREHGIGHAVTVNDILAWR